METKVLLRNVKRKKPCAKTAQGFLGPLQNDDFLSFLQKQESSVGVDKPFCDEQWKTKGYFAEAPFIGFHRIPLLF